MAFLKQVMVCLGILWSFPTLLNATYHDIKTFKRLDETLKSLGLSKTDMVVFDVDMVLVVPYDPHYQMPTLKKFKKEFKAVWSSMTPQKRDVFSAFFVTASPQVASNPGMPGLVRWVGKQCKYIYLTALSTGSMPPLYDVAEWRGNSLPGAGFPIVDGQLDSKLYKNFPKYHGAYPRRSGNLLMTNGSAGGVTKGMMLTTYMWEKQLHPKRIIMIDDQRKNLDDVRDALQDKYPGIDVILIHYTGAFSYYKVPAHYKELPDTYREPTKESFQKVLKHLQKQVKASGY